MAFLLIHHKVKDYNEWKPVFDSHAPARSESGSQGGRVFRSANDKNEIFVLFEWDSVSNARKFALSEKTKEVMEDAGVVGMPGVFIMEETSSTPK